MKQIFYKEAIKLNRILLAVIVINIGALIYTFFRVRVGFVMNEPSAIWLDIILKNGVYYTKVPVILYASALLLGLMQFYPEFDRRRFRLACHFPINENKMICYTIFFSVLVIFLLWVIDMAGIVFISSLFFPIDLYIHIPLVMFYYLVNALIIYAFASILTLETSWNVKLRFAILLFWGIWLFKVEVYNGSILYGIMAFIFAFFYLVSIYYPALRFRKGL